MEATVLQFFEGIRNPFLTAAFSAFTALGETTVLIIAIALIYWLYNKEFGERLALTILFSDYVAYIGKTLVARTRPYAAGVVSRIEIDNPFVDTVGLDAGYSFPSGHATNAVGFFAPLALFFKKKSVWVVSAVVVLLVMLSRLYLGVHFPTDVLAGFLMGAIGVIAVYFLYKTPEKTRTMIMLGVSVLSVLGLFLMEKHLFRFSGGLCGATLAFYLEHKFVKFEMEKEWWKKVLRALVGLIVILVPFGGLTLIASKVDAELLKFIVEWAQYFLTLIFAMVIAPMLFKKLKI